MMPERSTTDNAVIAILDTVLARTGYLPTHDQIRDGSITIGNIRLKAIRDKWAEGKYLDPCPRRIALAEAKKRGHVERPVSAKAGHRPHPAKPYQPPNELGLTERAVKDYQKAARNCGLSRGRAK